MSIRLLVTGSRKWVHMQSVANTLDFYTRMAFESGHRLEVTHGDAYEGADNLASGWVTRWGKRGWPVDQDAHPARWNDPCADRCEPNHRRTRKDGTDFCPYAGHRRNGLMVDLQPAVCVAFWRNNSPGTRDCFQKAEKAGIPLLKLTWDLREHVDETWLRLNAPRFAL